MNIEKTKKTVKVLSIVLLVLYAVIVVAGFVLGIMYLVNTKYVLGIIWCINATLFLGCFIVNLMNYKRFMRDTYERS